MAAFSRLRTRFWMAITIAAMGGIIFFACWVYRIQVLLADGYAQWRVAEIVIKHMERNCGEWPRRWEDLRESYEICAGCSGAFASLDHLRSRVEVEFQVDPAKLALAQCDGAPLFRVIFPRRGGHHNLEGRDPNCMILEYLKRRANGSKANVRLPRLHATETVARGALLEMGAPWRLDDRTGRVVFVNMTSPKGSPRYSDTSVVHLAKFSHLRELSLGYSNITDKALTHIVGLHNLARVDLYGTNVTDAGLAMIAKMKSLEFLVLASDNVSDAGMHHIGGMKQLTFVNLNGTRITDCGLRHLGNLDRLRELLLYNTRVTKAGVDKLRLRIPNCEIRW